MSEPPPLEAPITLDQLKVFLCVVEEGSFSRAARKLRRVQSAVSYAIANLERLLDVELFDRSGQKPLLTDAGRALLADVEAVSDRVDRLQARARSLARGLEPHLSLAIDPLFPMPVLLASLHELRDRHPQLMLQLRTEALGAVAQLVLEGAAQIGISVDLEPFPRELSKHALGRIELVPAIAASHPLAHAARRLEAADFEEVVQIVLSDRSELTAGRDYGVLSPQTWRVADLSAKRELMLAGFGWGQMPLHWIEEYLRAGRLVRLDVEGLDGVVRMVAVARTADPPGPAGAWLLERLRVGCAATREPPEPKKAASKKK